MHKRPDHKFKRPSMDVAWPNQRAILTRSNFDSTALPISLRTRSLWKIGSQRNVKKRCLPTATDGPARHQTTALWRRCSGWCQRAWRRLLCSPKRTKVSRSRTTDSLSTAARSSRFRWAKARKQRGKMIRWTSMRWTKAQDRENRKEKARKAETKANASRAMPKTATGKRAGQKKVTKRQIGRQNLAQDGGRQQTIGHHGNQKKQWVKLRSTAWKNARATRARTQVAMVARVTIGRHSCMVWPQQRVGRALSEFSQFQYSSFKKDARDLQGETFVYTSKNTKVYVPQRQ